MLEDFFPMLQPEPPPQPLLVQPFDLSKVKRVAHHRERPGPMPRRTSESSGREPLRWGEYAVQVTIWLFLLFRYLAGASFMLDLVFLANLILPIGFFFAHSAGTWLVLNMYIFFCMIHCVALFFSIGYPWGRRVAMYTVITGFVTLNLDIKILTLFPEKDLGSAGYKWLEAILYCRLLSVLVLAINFGDRVFKSWHVASGTDSDDKRVASYRLMVEYQRFVAEQKKEEERRERRAKALAESQQTETKAIQAGPTPSTSSADASLSTPGQIVVLKRTKPPSMSKRAKEAREKATEKKLLAKGKTAVKRPDSKDAATSTNLTLREHLAKHSPPRPADETTAIKRYVPDDSEIVTIEEEDESSPHSPQPSQEEPKVGVFSRFRAWTSGMFRWGRRQEESSKDTELKSMKVDRATSPIQAAYEEIAELSEQITSQVTEFTGSETTAGEALSQDVSSSHDTTPQELAPDATSPRRAVSQPTIPQESVSRGQAEKPFASQSAIIRGTASQESTPRPLRGNFSAQIARLTSRPLPGIPDGTSQQAPASQPSRPGSAAPQTKVSPADNANTSQHSRSLSAGAQRAQSVASLKANSQTIATQTYDSFLAALKTAPTRPKAGSFVDSSQAAAQQAASLQESPEERTARRRAARAAAAREAKLACEAAARWAAAERRRPPPPPQEHPYVPMAMCERWDFEAELEAEREAAREAVRAAAQRSGPASASPGTAVPQARAQQVLEPRPSSSHVDAPTGSAEQTASQRQSVPQSTAQEAPKRLTVVSQSATGAPQVLLSEATQVRAEPRRGPTSEESKQMAHPQDSLRPGKFKPGDKIVQGTIHNVPRPNVKPQRPPETQQPQRPPGTQQPQMHQAKVLVERRAAPADEDSIEASIQARYPMIWDLPSTDWMQTQESPKSTGPKSPPALAPITYPKNVGPMVFPETFVIPKCWQKQPTTQIGSESFTTPTAHTAPERVPPAAAGPGTSREQETEPEEGEKVSPPSSADSIPSDGERDPLSTDSGKTVIVKSSSMEDISELPDE